MRKHSLVIAGHATSVSLEQEFWDVLKEIADRRGIALAALIAEVDAERAENLSSAPSARMQPLLAATAAERKRRASDARRKKLRSSTSTKIPVNATTISGAVKRRSSK